MYSFYGGQKGQDFKVSRIFANRSQDMLKDLQARWYSPVNVGDYVFINYGDIAERDKEIISSDNTIEIEKSNYRKNLEIDLLNCGKSYANSLWQKVYVDDNKKISPNLPESDNDVYVFINFDDLNTTAVNSIIEYNGKTYRIGEDGNWYDKDDIECLKILRYHQVGGQSLLESSDIYSDNNFGFGYRLIACITGETPKLDVEYNTINIEEGDPYLTLDLTIPENPKLKFYLQRSQVLKSNRVGAVEISPLENPSVNLITEGTFSLKNSSVQDVSLTYPGLKFNLPRAVQFFSGNLFGQGDLSQITLNESKKEDQNLSKIYSLSKKETQLKSSISTLLSSPESIYERTDSIPQKKYNNEIREFVKDDETLKPYFNEKTVLERLKEGNKAYLPLGFYGIKELNNLSTEDHYNLLLEIYNNLESLVDFVNEQSNEQTEEINCFSESAFISEEGKENRPISGDFNIIKEELSIEYPGELVCKIQNNTPIQGVNDENGQIVFKFNLQFKNYFDRFDKKIVHCPINIIFKQLKHSDNLDYYLSITKLYQNPNCVMIESKKDENGNYVGEWYVYNDKLLTYKIDYVINTINNINIDDEKWEKAGLVNKNTFIEMSKEERVQYIKNYKHGLNHSYSPVIIAELLGIRNPSINFSQILIDLLSLDEEITDEQLYIFSSIDEKNYFFELLDIANNFSTSFTNLLASAYLGDMYIHVPSGRLYQIFEMDKIEEVIYVYYLGALTAPAPSVSYEEIPAFIKDENGEWTRNKSNVISNVLVSNNEQGYKETFIFQTPAQPNFDVSITSISNENNPEGEINIIKAENEDNAKYSIDFKIPRAIRFYSEITGMTYKNGNFTYSKNDKGLSLVQDETVMTGDIFMNLNPEDYTQYRGYIYKAKVNFNNTITWEENGTLTGPIGLPKIIDEVKVLNTETQMDNLSTSEDGYYLKYYEKELDQVISFYSGALPNSAQGETIIFKIYNEDNINSSIETWQLYCYNKGKNDEKRIAYKISGLGGNGNITLYNNFTEDEDDINSITTKGYTHTFLNNILPHWEILPDITEGEI